MVENKSCFLQLSIPTIKSNSIIRNYSLYYMPIYMHKKPNTRERERERASENCETDTERENESTSATKCFNPITRWVPFLSFWVFSLFFFAKKIWEKIIKIIERKIWNLCNCEHQGLNLEFAFFSFIYLFLCPLFFSPPTKQSIRVSHACPCFLLYSCLKL